jgi:putative ATPase
MFEDKVIILMIFFMILMSNQIPKPLAQILRPKTLDDVIGQVHLVGKDGILRKFLATGFLPSMIFWGPPGVGKTTLAELVATITDAHFESHSAVTSTLADVRRIIKESEDRLTKGKKTVFFL